MHGEYTAVDLQRWPDSVGITLSATPSDVVFDMDGTLLAVDAAEGLLLRLRAEGRLAAEARALADGDPWEVYEALLARGEVMEAFALCACCFAGRTEAELAAEVAADFATGRLPLRAPIVALALALREAGHRVWIVTGSPAALGRAVAARIGLDPALVVGIELEHDGDRLLPAVRGPVSGGPGKITAMALRIGRAPLLAVGDSVFDLPMLRHATIGGILVPPRETPWVTDARDEGIAVRLPDDLGG